MVLDIKSTLLKKHQRVLLIVLHLSKKIPNIIQHGCPLDNTVSLNGYSHDFDDTVIQNISHAI